VRYLSERGFAFKKSGPEVSKGWIGIQCMFCGDTSGSTHGAFNLKYGNYNCWRCGKHPVYKVIAELENCSYKKAFEILKEYTSDSLYETEEEVYANSLDIRKLAQADKMKKHHRLYLQKRNFDDKKLEKEYGLLGTNIGGDYSHRIIAPIIYNKVEVSFQGRTILDIEPRYLACEKEKEVIHYKNILYNLDRVQKNILLVEGITSVWRIGPGSVASFGSIITTKQTLLLLTKAKKYDKHIFVCLDPEPSAQKIAQKIVFNIKSIYDKVANIVLTEDEDPAEMSDRDILILRKELGL